MYHERSIVHGACKPIWNWLLRPMVVFLGFSHHLQANATITHNYESYGHVIDKQWGGTTMMMMMMMMMDDDGDDDDDDDDDVA